MGTSVSSPAVWEIWSRRFASAARNDVNFMARPLNQISFFAILSVVSVKWIFFTAENWSERLWRLIKHRCIMRIDGSDNAYYVQLCYEKWYVHIENSDFSYTLQLTAISVHKPIVDKQNRLETSSLSCISNSNIFAKSTHLRYWEVPHTLV